MNALLLTFGIVLLFMVLANWIKTKQIIKNLEHLKDRAFDFSQGDFSQKIVLSQKAPLALRKLGQALNQMREQLGQRIETILKQKKDQEVIFASMAEGIVTFDSERNITHINPVAITITLNWLEDQQKQNQNQNQNQNTAPVVGRPLIEIFRHPMLEELSKVVLESGKAVEEELELAPQRIFQVHGTSLKGDRGDTGGLLVFRDITRIRELERKQKEFVANVSHELRTPLTSIQGFVETLLDDSIELESSKVQKVRGKFLRIIQRHSQRLRDLIEDLLTLAHLEKDQSSSSQSDFLQKISVPLAPLLNSAIQTCEYKSKAKDIAFNVQTPPLKVLANASLLEQCIINLLDNAIKYSASHTTVSIKCLPQEEEETLAIAIQDQGPGIAPEHIPHIFERFYVVDKSQGRHFGGPGLGLSIVKHIVQIHGGQVGVRSILGKGSTFTIVLPQAIKKS